MRGYITRSAAYLYRCKVRGCPNENEHFEAHDRRIGILFHFMREHMDIYVECGGTRRGFPKGAQRGKGNPKLEALRVPGAKSVSDILEALQK